MSVSLRRMDAFPVKDVRTTNEYAHLRYCYPNMTHSEIVQKILPIQRICFIEDEFRTVFYGSCLFPNSCDGIYDVWLENMINITRVTIKLIDTSSSKKSKNALILYETEVHPSETRMQIPLSLPESENRVQTCFQHFLRDGSINLSYVPLLSLGRNTAIMIETNSDGKADLVLSTVHLANRNKWYLATHENRFYVGGCPFVVSGGKVKKYIDPTKRPWWERVIPLFGLKVHA